MDGSIAGDEESTSESTPSMARFVVITIKSDGGAEDSSVFTPEEQPKAIDPISVERGAERITCVSIKVESEEYTICRICHLRPELVGLAAEGWEQIQIGCGCKGDLEFAHRRCAEAWFRVRRNSLIVARAKHHDPAVRISFEPLQSFPQRFQLDLRSLVEDAVDAGRNGALEVGMELGFQEIGMELG